MSRTYAILDVSQTAFDEIKAKLDAAGYDHALEGGELDMHGIALRCISEVKCRCGGPAKFHCRMGAPTCYAHKCRCCRPLGEAL